ncbi:MAG: 23S rRNA (uracil(1939)-C(5))-methyltransferase RlmD [Patescibacteria group bacterium]
MLVKIDKIIYTGWGLGRDSNGRVVLVKKSVPGDTIEVDIMAEKKNCVLGRVGRVVRSGPARIEPACVNFDRCGGCEHMNVAYPVQLQIKSAAFAEVLVRQGLDIKPEPIIAGAQENFYYRNSIRFFFHREADGTISFARHRGDTAATTESAGLLPIDYCLLQSKTSNKILARLKSVLNSSPKSNSSLWQIKIREGKTTGEFMVEIVTTSEELPNQREIVTELAKVTGVKSLYHTVAPAKSLKNLRRRLIFGSPVIREKVGRFTFQISPESFFQTNALAIKTLYDTIKKYAEVKPGDTVLDLYCGTGTIGIYLSTLAKKIIGVETVAGAVRDARDNLRLNHIHNCEFVCTDVNKYLEAFSTEHLDFDIIVVDPPRAGLAPRIIQILSHLALSHSQTRFIYVSCNPATFACDAKLLESGGVRLRKIQPIDMFPHTHHIECVGLFTATPKIKQVLQ